MKVAVVILNWNRRDLLEKFLPSVVKFSAEATVYVADNASTDDSISFIYENFPTVKIIQNKVNGGYAKGYNDALKNLSEDIFVLLNSDVEVTENWLQPIISEFEKDASVVAAQPKILDYKNREYFEYAGAAGGFIDKYGYPYCRGRIFNTLEKDHGQYNDTAEIFWASGACLFVKTDAFWQAGGLDEDYFAHQEEIDLCWRLQAKGGKILYVGTSQVYHVGGATLAALNPQKTFYNFRNSLLNLLKNAGGAQAFSAIFVRMVLDAVAAFQFLFQGKPKHFLAVIKAHFSFYFLVPKFLKKRRRNASKMKYFKIKSIVFQHFIMKKEPFQ
ncbi:MAG: dTDP-Rha--alpha-D-GlcNAc-pyrophosphate polyprenol alpha-3-L-rhamnosyltransferase [Aequorivita sp.]|nr:dTDP-Rha--alpha-D-GlcNAc-pyrophosphate polyprenol alpha-3-L-rhamnosyltransferase [Aequorivita sp.]MBF32466.1 dTDP-Rha--alpha-D-GlcNAc-pyrophosphate polyprenol alpha-3-L-rhamnosyltransferase [Aequorivita sp.]